MQYGRCSLQPPATLPTLCVFDREPLDVAATATALAAALARYPRDTHAVLLLDQPLLHAAHALHHALQVRLWCKTHISLHVGAPVPQDAPCTVVPAKSLPRLLLPRTPPPWLPPTPPPCTATPLFHRPFNHPHMQRPHVVAPTLCTVCACLGGPCCIRHALAAAAAAGGRAVAGAGSGDWRGD